MSDAADRAVRFFEMLRHTKGQFAGKPFILLPWQRQIVRDVYGTVKADGRRQYKYAVLFVPKKNGKALMINTLIPTPDGWKRMADIRVGDRVFSETGTPCRVVATSEVMTGRPCYRIKFTSGQEIIADANHEWLTTTRRPEAKTAIRTTEQISRSVASANGLNHRIRVAGALDIPEKDLPLHPYLFGLWLGDGNSRDARITIADQEALDVIHSLGYETGHRDSFGKYGHFVYGINPVLRGMGVFANKHIPEAYLFSSFEQRLELLRGLMDSDGYCSPKGQCEFTSKNQTLANALLKLVRSLGIKATLTEGRSMLNGKDCGPKFRVCFNPDASVKVFHLQRKSIRQNERDGETRSMGVYIESCEQVASQPVMCIQVDSPSHLYLAGESFIPTHNSEMVAGAGLYHTFADGERNGEVYGCAADREQASLVFDVAVDMIDQSPALKKRAKLTLSQKIITDKVTGTFYKVVSSEAYTKHGLNISACIFDELHAQPNRNLWDVMTKGAGDARRQPIWWVISTAGEDPDRVSIGWEVYERAKKVLEARASGDLENDIATWYPVIFEYPGDDIYNPEHWAIANPSLGQTFTVENLHEAAAEAKQNPADERLFRWLRLNQWVTYKLTTWLPLDLFDQTVGDWDRADLLGKDCYIGLDLSSTTDLTAIALLFPPQGEQTDWRVIWHNWIPAANMEERLRRDKVPYDQWAAGNWITPTEGDVVDYTKVEAAILDAQKFYRVIEVPSDRAFAAMLLQRLEQAHLTCVDVPQTFKTLTSPINLVETLMREGKLTHEANPVARWAFGNASIAKNGNGEIKLVKEHKGRSVDRTKRIDPMVALVNAMAMAQYYDSGRSIYADRDLIVL